MMRDELHIAINVQIDPGAWGGVEPVLVGLVQALGQLADGNERYVLICSEIYPDWIQPHLSANMRIEVAPGIQYRHDRLPYPLRPIAGWLRQKLLTLLNVRVPQIPVSDGFYESLGCQVIHFPYQSYVVCGLPAIYTPHDLQHLHFPQFFSAREILKRQLIFPAAFQTANTTTVGSQWVKDDILRHYHVPSDKIQVIPWANPAASHQAPDADHVQSVRQTYELAEEFCIYPAQSWAHKNHVRLLQAIAQLRDKHDKTLHLVCTGSISDYYRQVIKPEIDRLELQDQVKFLGFVPGEHLRALYRLSKFIVIPTLFEAASSMIFEAWEEDIPITCARTTSLPEQAAGSALIFDPYSIDSIADAIHQMDGDAELRDKLRQRGRERRQDFSWERTAKAYRAVYRRAAGFTLNEEDKHLLQWDWMRDPANSAKEQDTA